MLLAVEQMPNDWFMRAASLSFFVFIIGLNCIWVIIKIELSSQGRRCWFTLNNLREFKLLAAQQEKLSTRRAYNALRYAWYTCFILMFVVPLTLLGIGYLFSHTH